MSFSLVSSLLHMLLTSTFCRIKVLRLHICCRRHLSIMYHIIVTLYIIAYPLYFTQNQAVIHDPHMVCIYNVRRKGSRRTRPHPDKLTVSFASTTTMTTPESSVDLLILGAGWTADFLIPLCESTNVSYAATTRHQVRTLQAKDKRIYFQFDPSSDDPTPFKTLPHAKTVLIVFPIKVEGGSTKLVRLYEETHEGAKGKTGFIQLGSTGIWDVRTHPDHLR